MCFFIIAILPGSADLASLATLFRASRLGFTPVVNARLQGHLKPGDVQIITTQESKQQHCDCDTELGILNDDDDTEIDRPENHVGRLRKKGWSEAKILRWIEQKGQALERVETDRAAHSLHWSGREPRTLTAHEWERFLVRVLGSGLTPRISLFLHMYHGYIETEEIKVQGRETIVRAAISPDLLRAIHQDVIYEFLPGK